MNKFYITGCAKTGTTLLRRLFNAFDLNVYNKTEIHLSKFISESKYDVGKRTAGSIFSDVINKTMIDSYLGMIEKNQIKIINITRNREDTLKSSNGYVKPKRYDESIRQSKLYSDYISDNITYEELVENPDKIQNELSKFFNLKILHKWSDFPDWYDNKDEIGPNLNSKEYKLRKVGEKNN